MTEDGIEQRVQLLSARVEALMKFVETLYVENLASESDPNVFVDAWREDILNAEKKQREEFGDNYYSLQIAEIASSFLDRALALKRREADK
jgi:hypothetical protein